MTVIWRILITQFRLLIREFQVSFRCVSASLIHCQTCTDLKRKSNPACDIGKVVIVIDCQFYGDSEEMLKLSLNITAASKYM